MGTAWARHLHISSSTRSLAATITREYRAPRWLNTTQSLRFPSRLIGTSVHPVKSLQIKWRIHPEYILNPPHKRVKKSYIWQAGIGLAVIEVKSGKKFWLCHHCYDNPVPQPLYLVETDSTTPAIRHLQSRHNYDEKGRRHGTAGQKRKRDAEDIRDAVKRLRDEKEKPFDAAGWKRAYLRWIVSDNQSLSLSSEVNGSVNLVIMVRTVRFGWLWFT